VHYVLVGSGTITVDGQEPLRFGPNRIIIPPRDIRRSIVFAEAAGAVTAEDARRVLPDGLVALTRSHRYEAEGRTHPH
jgi:hypothetical protein